MEQDRLPRALRLFLDSPQVVVDGLANRLTSQRLDKRFDVGRVQVHWLPSGLIGDLFSLDHDELPALFYKRAKLIERLQSDRVTGCVRISLGFYPMRSKPVEILSS